MWSMSSNRYGLKESAVGDDAIKERNLIWKNKLKERCLRGVQSQREELRQQRRSQLCESLSAIIVKNLKF
jgi:hypothetical protein